MGLEQIVASVIGLILGVANVIGIFILSRIFFQLDKLDKAIKEETRQRNDDYRSLANDISKHPEWVDTKDFVKAIVTPIKESADTIQVLLQTFIATNNQGGNVTLSNRDN